MARFASLMFYGGLAGAQLLHHSTSPFGPWEPVVPEGCNGSTGIWRDGGGNNQSPFYVTAAVARATGLPEDSLVAITTFGLKNRSGGVPHPYANATLASFFAVGIAKNWTAPMVIRKQPLFKNPGVVVWEDPYFYFDLRRNVWRALWHEVPGKAFPGYQPLPGIHEHCGGYAESATPDIWGDWTVSPPQCGAYTLNIETFTGLGPSPAAAREAVGTTAGPSTGECGRVTIHHTRGCWNDSSWSVNSTAPSPILPTYVRALARDELSLEACAAACNEASLPVAGVAAGAHCFCGTAADLSTPAAAALARPKAECKDTPCGGNPAERECGGQGRVLAYDYSCSVTPTPPPPPSPAPSCTQPPPFKFGRSYPAFANESLTSWGGNAVRGDDGQYHMYTSAMSYGRHLNAALSDLIPGPCSIGSWERQSLVVHAVAPHPVGPFKLSDIALGSSHTNPQIMRTPGGHWLLFSQATCANDQYSHVCTGCHKGLCGPQPCDRPSRFPPLPPGKLSVSRRERPKMLFDDAGRPTHLFNSADPGGAATPPNPGWQRDSRPFTMVTEIIDS